MNEEFGVLKDMIPACEGVEMHKLAILQAGIEYVRYLEGCVAQLKNENQKQKIPPPSSRMQIDEQEEDDLEDDDDDEEDEDEMVQDQQPEPAPPVNKRHGGGYNTSVPDKWAMRDSRSSIASLSSSAHPSPHILSQTQSLTDDQGAGLRKRPILPAGVGSFSASPSQISTNITSATPTPTLLSPAFNSIHFSPDLSRTQTNSSSIGKSTGSGSFAAPSTSGSWTTVNPTSNPSPNMQPLPSPKAAINLPLPHPSTSLQLPQPLTGAVERDAHSKSPGAQSDVSGTAEATASAALMMLTNDWRGGAAGRGAGPAAGAGTGGDGDRGKGMSVRDLLSS